MAEQSGKGGIEKEPDFAAEGAYNKNSKQDVKEDSAETSMSYKQAVVKSVDPQVRLLAEEPQQTILRSSEDIVRKFSDGPPFSYATEDVLGESTHDAISLSVALLAIGETEYGCTEWKLKFVLADDSAALLSCLGSEKDAKNSTFDRLKLFHYACKTDAVKCASALLEGGEGLEAVPIDAVDESGMTALHYAVVSGSLRCLELLLKKNVKLDIQCRSGQTPLEATLDNLRVSMAWPRAGNIVELLKLAQKQNLSAVKLLISYMNDIARFACHLALSGDIEALAILLVVAGKEIVSTTIRNFSDQGDCTITDLLVHKAIFTGGVKVHESSHSVSVDRQMALKQLELLLVWKPNLNKSIERPQGISPTSNFSAPLLQAAKAADEAVTTLLLEAGAFPNETGSDGNSALHLCLLSSNGEAAARVVWKLIEKGAHASVGNDVQVTPVHIAAGQGHLDALKVLLAREPSAANAMAATRETPLFWAVRNNQFNCVKLLLSYGADKGTVNLRKQMPIDVADNLRMREILEESAGIGSQHMSEDFMDSFISVKSKKKKTRIGGVNVEFNPSLSGASTRTFLPKTELCRYFTMAGGCIRGDSCFFAHGEKELVCIPRSPLKEIKSASAANTETARLQLTKLNAEEMGKKIFVGGLSPSVESEDLREYFEEHFGPVSDAVVIGSQSAEHKFVSRGFGFVTFKHDYSLLNAVKEHYVVLFGKKVEIKGAVPRFLLQAEDSYSLVDSKKNCQLRNSDSNQSPMNANSDSSCITEETIVRGGADNAGNSPFSGDSSSAESTPAVRCNESTESSPQIPPLPLTHGPRPAWLLKLRQWLPSFLLAVSSRLKEGEYYPLSSLKGDFRATCGLELDHVNIGYLKLSDFVRSLHDICRMKIVPVGRGPATHMVLLPYPRCSQIHAGSQQTSGGFKNSLVDTRRTYAAAANGESYGASLENSFVPGLLDGQEDEASLSQARSQDNLGFSSSMNLQHSFPHDGSQAMNQVRRESPLGFDRTCIRTPSPGGTRANSDEERNSEHRKTPPPPNVDYVSHLLSLLGRPGSESQASIIQAYRTFQEKTGLQHQQGRLESSPPPRWHQQIGETLPRLPETPEQIQQSRHSANSVKASLGENTPPSGLFPEFGRTPNRAGAGLVSESSNSSAMGSSRTLGSTIWDSPTVNSGRSTFSFYQDQELTSISEGQSEGHHFNENRNPARSLRMAFQDSSPTHSGGIRPGVDLWTSPARRFPNDEGLTEQVLNLQPMRAAERPPPRRTPWQDFFGNNVMPPVRPPNWFGPVPPQAVIPPFHPEFGPRAPPYFPMANAMEGNTCAYCCGRRALWTALPCGHRILCTVCKEIIQHQFGPSNFSCLSCKCAVGRWAVIH